jgi:hypothetical protein
VGYRRGLDAQLRAMLAGNQVEMGALKFDTAQASARSMEVKCWMEQTQATGGGTTEQASRTQVLQVEIGGLRNRCDFLEGAFTQMVACVTTLKDKLGMGLGVEHAPAHPLLLCSNMTSTCWPGRCRLHSIASGRK